MNTSKQVFTGLFIVAGLTLPAFVQGSDSRTSAKSQPTLAIARDPGTSKIIVSWTGEGILKQSTELNGHFNPLHDGSKYSDGSGYEASTFEAIKGAWSNPKLQIPIGTGFYFNNPSAETFPLTFVGDVLQGVLINPLPAGTSTKGALVPQAGSINSAHQIPGQPGDEIQIYTNDQQGGGSYSVSIFDAQQNAWVPDLTLQVAQGFWIQKQYSQDWVRTFFVN